MSESAPPRRTSAPLRPKSRSTLVPPVEQIVARAAVQAARLSGREAFQDVVTGIADARHHHQHVVPCAARAPAADDHVVAGAAGHAAVAVMDHVPSVATVHVTCTEAGGERVVTVAELTGPTAPAVQAAA